MADQDRLRLMLELEVGSDPIVGSLQAGGRRLPFAGWVGLAMALEEIMSSAADGRPDPGTPDNGPSAGLGQLR